MIGLLVLIAAAALATYVLVSEWRYHTRLLRAWQEGYNNGLLMTGIPFPLEDDMTVVRAFNEGYRTGLSKRRVSTIAEPKRTRSAGWTRAMDYTSK